MPDPSTATTMNSSVLEPHPLNWMKPSCYPLSDHHCHLTHRNAYPFRGNTLSVPFPFPSPFLSPSPSHAHALSPRASSSAFFPHHTLPESCHYPLLQLQHTPYGAWPDEPRDGLPRHHTLACGPP